LRNVNAIVALLLASFARQAIAQDSLMPADPPYYRVRYEPSQKSGELVYGVSYTVWIPPGVPTLRGLIVHQHGCGEGACKAGRTAAYDLHWQALARKYECALLGPSYEQPEQADCSMWCDPRNGSEKRFLQALDDLAAASKHQELSKVPWALWGHSGGGTWAGTMLALHPDRCAAVVLRSGVPRLGPPREGAKLPELVMPEAAFAVPVMCNLGTREGVTDKSDRFAGVWPGVQKFFLSLRSKGALIGLSVDPNSSHDCGNSRYLAIPWFDACLAARLPDKAGDVALKPMPTKHVYLAPLLGHEAKPAAEFTGDVKESVWLPNATVAKAWEQYGKDGNVADATPPPAPTNVKLGSGNELTWNAQADVESGIAAFLIERDGKEIARVPEKPTGSVGRQVFQKTGYSDTPSPPLAEMRFKVKEAGGKLAVRTVNSAGLESEAAEVK
jgi:pimeloyl-ACP methyl ester carboxylesterase